MIKALYLKIPKVMLKDDPDGIKPMAMRMVKRKKGYKHLNHILSIHDNGEKNTKTLVVTYDSYKAPRIAIKTK